MATESYNGIMNTVNEAEMVEMVEQMILNSYEL